jgi:outer membrane protein assembly factor BamB
MSSNREIAKGSLMQQVLHTAFLALLLLGWCAAAPAADDSVPTGDWPWWRGPHRNGIADPNQTPPAHWSERDNVLWKAPVPGRGHGSPIVSGDRVFIAAAEPEIEIQSLLCFDRKTGKLLWKKQVHQGGFEKKGNGKSTLASSTPATDGARVFINFLHAGAVYLTALNYQGEQLWQTKVADYVLYQGYGSSPTIFKSLVILAVDTKGGGALAGLDRATGKIVWSNKRPLLPNYPSPIILEAAGREQLFMTGCDLVSSFDPLSGKKLWEMGGATTECVTSIVTDGRLVFTSGGYPKQHVSAVEANGSGKLVWENKARVYVPSMIVRDGHLYAIMDGAGMAVCWSCDTGKEMWKARLGGVFSSSLVLVGDKLYAVNEDGKSFIYKAIPERFELIAQNKLGDEAMSSPAICGGQIFLRIADKSDAQRQEWLYCLGKRE